MANFLDRDGQLVVEFKVKTGNQVLVAMSPLQIECLASKLVFGTKGLILRSSMALIPTETSSIFCEGKIHRMNYNMMKPIVDSIILSYISVDFIVIHRKITRIQDITSLENTPITKLI